MRKYIVIPLIWLAAIGAAPPDSSPESLIDAVQTAERAGDVASLEKLIRPDFVQHHASGTVEPRVAYLADRSATTTNPTSGRGYLERDVQWRRSGNVAMRTSIARIRGAKPGADLWVRSTAMVVREKDRWRLFNLDSALLLDTPEYDGPAADKLPTAQFASKEGGRFRFLMRGGQPYLEFENGREIPLIATAPDLYWSGTGSTLSIVRDAGGNAKSVIRKYGNRIAWTAALL
jgi:ketosteroid isomerase-like protein